MTYNKKIVIIDYGLGNIHSIIKAFSSFGVNAILSNDQEIIKEADGVVLPGVGAFAAAMRGLEKHHLVGVIKEVAKDNTPLLGICVGAQMLFSEGHEFGIHKGLDLIPGKVLRFSSLECGEKIPHVGWNSAKEPTQGFWKNSIFSSLTAEDQLYFVHSYFFLPDNSEDVFSETVYGDFKFCSTVRKGNVYGCQFHPEKSGKIGLSIIENFIKNI